MRTPWRGRAWFACALVVATPLVACGNDPTGPDERPPSARTVLTTTATVPPGTAAGEPSVSASSTTATTAALAPGDLNVQSSDEQRCAIAAEAGLAVDGCPG